MALARHRAWLLPALAAAAAALLLFTASGSASAQGGPTADQLQKAGWTCFDPDGPGPLGIHCTPPGDDASDASSGVMVYDQTGQEFQGTELLLRPDLYHGQPCPQDGHDEYEDIGFARACHHYETGH